MTTTSAPTGLPLRRPRALALIDRLGGAPTALLDQALVSGSNFLLVGVAARVLSTADFANFGLAYLLIVIATNFHQALVLTPLGVLAPERDGMAQHAYLARLIRLHRPLLPLALGLGLAPFCPPSAGLAVAAAAAAAIRIALEHERRTAYVLHDSTRALLIDACAHLPQIALVLALLGLAACPVWLPMAAIVGGGLGGIAVARLLLATERRASPEPLASVAGAHWHFGRWLVGATSIQTIAEHLYPFLVFGLLGARETAFLVAGRQLINIGNVALNGLENYAVPRLRGTYLAQGIRGLRWGLVRIGLGLVGLGVVPCVVAIIAGDQVMALIYGVDYAQAGWLLGAFVVPFVCRVLARLQAMGLLAMKFPGAGFVAVSLGATCTLTIGPWLVATHGLLGVIVAYTVNQVLMVLCLNLGLIVATRRAGRGLPSPSGD